MVLNRTSKKVAFDSATGFLLALGTAGLGFGVYQKEVIPGLFGIASILLAIVISYLRNTWNEGEKNNNIQEVVRNEIVKSVPVIVRTVKPIVKPVIEDIKKDIKEEIKEKTDKIIDKVVDKVGDKVEEEIKEKAEEIIKPLFGDKP